MGYGELSKQLKKSIHTFIDDYRISLKKGTGILIESVHATSCTFNLHLQQILGRPEGAARFGPPHGHGHDHDRGVDQTWPLKHP